jgi:hypothetical protein
METEPSAATMRDELLRIVSQSFRSVDQVAICNHFALLSLVRPGPSEYEDLTSKELRSDIHLLHLALVNAIRVAPAENLALALAYARGVR